MKEKMEGIVQPQESKEVDTSDVTLELGMMYKRGHWAEGVNDGVEAINEESLFGLVRPGILDEKANAKLKNQVPQSWLQAYHEETGKYLDRVKAVNDAIEQGEEIKDSAVDAEKDYSRAMAQKCPGLVAKVAMAQSEYILRHISEGYMGNDPVVQKSQKERAALWKKMAEKNK